MKTNLTLLAAMLVVVAPCFLFAQSTGTLLPAASPLTRAQLNKTTATGCPTGTEVAPIYNTAFERELLHRVNEYRQTNNRGPLRWNANLANVARLHGQDMADLNYVAHDSYPCGVTGTPTGAPPTGCSVSCTMSDRVDAFYEWVAVAENIAWGQSTPATAFSGFQNSTSHNANMLSADFREAGFGYVRDLSAALTSHLWIQVFGSMSNVFPIVINNDSAETSNPTVSIYIYHPTTHTEVRFSNDNSTWGTWTSIPTGKRLNWTLSAGNGDKTVYAQTRPTGNSIVPTTVQSTISLNAGGSTVARSNPLAQALLVWPNPAHGLMNISVPATLIHQPLQMLDAAGRVVWQQQVQSPIVEANLAHLPRGIYLLRCQSVTQRVVLQ